jgi:hypothetical protein
LLRGDVATNVRAARVDPTKKEEIMLPTEETEGTPICQEIYEKETDTAGLYLMCLPASYVTHPQPNNTTIAAIGYAKQATTWSY